MELSLTRRKALLLPFYGDFAHDRLMAYAEKARLVVEGYPPRLENTGFF